MLSDWVEAARPRTLPAALAPVIAGSFSAASLGSFSFPRALLAAAVALALQIGVNFANDYSDGIRGTDDHRTGPPRLTGGGKARPGVVQAAAFACFGVAGLAGFALVALTGQWWLLALGALAVLAAWFYTGGAHPYGYLGLGEVFVFLFFGLMATAGTTYTQALRTDATTWLAAGAIGLIACAILMVNNIRDIPSDSAAGKRTLAVRLGERAARLAFCGSLLGAVFLGALGAFWYPGAAGVLALLPAAFLIARPVLRGARGLALIPPLRNAGLFELAFALLLGGGLLL